MKKQSVHLILGQLSAIGLSLLPVQTASGQSLVRSQDYLRNLVELSDVLGRAHALDTTCNGTTRQAWRQHMQMMLDIEAPYQTRLRRAMVNEFNTGYQTAKTAQPVCDASAQGLYDELARSGQALAGALTRATIEPTPRP
jgi:uncharacterized protein (TIGR02301 family)